MKYKLLLIIFSLFLFSCDDEQAAGPAEADTYIKFFGASHSDVAYVARQTPDGGCVLLGTTEVDNEGTSVFKIKAIKVDNNGNMLWQKVYPEFLEDQSDFNISLTGRSIIVVEDGYIIVGDSIKNNGATRSSLFVMKINDNPTDNSFNFTSLNYQDISETANEYHIIGLDIIQDSDGNFRTISNYMNDGGEIIGTIFSKLNTDLSFDVNECTYDFPGKLALVKSLSEANDGDFIFGGTNKNNPIDNSILRKIPACFKNQSGASQNIVNNPQNDYTAGQVISTNIGYAMVGSNVTNTGKTDVFFALLNSDGTVRSNYPIIYSDNDNTFDGIGSEDEQGLTIANTSDGGFIIAGVTLSETAGEEDILLMKIDVLGNIQWTRAIGNANAESATYIQQATDGGYLIFGNTEFGGIDTMVLIKTDKNGNVN